jgi:hypothetical protein
MENHVALPVADESAVPQQLPAFTPGPWVVEYNHPQNACVHIMADDYHEVATCYGGHEAEQGKDGMWGPHPTRDATARLIAAAPDMYFALSAAEAFIERLTPGGETLRRISAALKKARGEA